MRSTSKEARWITVAARRAALIAVLSIGCMVVSGKRTLTPTAPPKAQRTVEYKNELKSGAGLKWLKSQHLPACSQSVANRIEPARWRYFK
jgi:hypothetical protein